MSEGKRPGGLTALAVINFVFGGFGVLGMLFWVGIIVLLTANPENLAKATENNEQATEMVEFWKAHTGLLYAIMGTALLSAILQIISGVGYLKQKQFLGRTLGNGYAVMGIASSLLLALGVEEEKFGGGFSIGTMIGLIYPVLTLILINTTFKEDFVN